MRMKRLGAAEAVDHRGLFEVGGDAGDEAAQHPDRERHDRGDVDDAHADDRVRAGPTLETILYCAMNRPSAGSICTMSTARTKRLAPAEPEPADRHRGEEREEQAEEHDDERDREAHAERA